MGIELKVQTCKKCGVEKVLSDFYSNASCKLGVIKSCKVCENAAAKMRSNYNANWKRANLKKDKEKEKAYHAARYQAKKDEILATTRAWWEQNKERKRAAASAWKRKNLEKLRVYYNRRRASLVAAGGCYTSAEAILLLEAQGCVCANPFCGADLNLVPRHLDHIKALANGGTNGIENLQWLCQPCNLSKGVKDFEAWLLQRAEDT